MPLKVLLKTDFNEFVRDLITRHQVVGPKAKGARFVFGQLDSPDELRLDYDVTLLPPKKYLLPQREVLLKYRIGKMLDVEELTDDTKRVLLGVHSYDVQAIAQMDRYYIEEKPDAHYIARRQNTLIVGLDPINVSEKSFSSAMNAAIVDSGYDVMVTDLGDKYILDIATEAGEALLAGAACADASSEDIKARDAARAALAELCCKQEIKFKVTELPAMLEAGRKHPVWEEKGEKCLACGSCVMVCPSCYCFDVKDDVELNLVDGVRTRQWDGCVLEDFASVASGENFREEQTDRYRHRFYRKGLYLHEKFGMPACVGCGRCVTACLPDIANPVAVYNALKEG